MQSMPDSHHGEKMHVGMHTWSWQVTEDADGIMQLEVRRFLDGYY